MGEARTSRCGKCRRGCRTDGPSRTLGMPRAPEPRRRYSARTAKMPPKRVDAVAHDETARARADVPAEAWQLVHFHEGGGGRDGAAADAAKRRRGRAAAESPYMNAPRGWSMAYAAARRPAPFAPARPPRPATVARHGAAGASGRVEEGRGERRPARPARPARRESVNEVARHIEAAALGGARQTVDDGAVSRASRRARRLHATSAALGAAAKAYSLWATGSLPNDELAKR